jgi:hypothetical protein
MPMMAAKLGSETMAFLTRKRVGNKKYLQVVHNYRENGKHRQRVLMHVGPYASMEHALADWHRYVDDPPMDFPPSNRRYHAEKIEEVRAFLSAHNITVDEAELKRLRGLREHDRWAENDALVSV